MKWRGELVDLKFEMDITNRWSNTLRDDQLIIERLFINKYR